MEKTIECIAKDRCTGCGACFNKCPVGAISMKYDSEGFLFPYVDKKKCIECGLCLQVCSAENNSIQSRTRQKYYAVWADEEIRNESSSGGMFTLLAQYVLGLRGAVCGCRYTQDYQYAHHTIIETEEELQQLRKSKYIQSEIRDVYIKVEQMLMQDRWVLFSGTPCQVVGLYTYLNKDYKKLLTVDIICHGVPSIKAYHKYLEENSQQREIEYVDFRDKSIVPWGTVEYIKFKDGTHYYNDCYKGMWYKAFLSGMSTRKSCGLCKYANSDRQGDFTIGDFWGISDICPEIGEKQGVSLVLVNSDKAHKFFKRVVSKAKYKEVEKNKVLELAKTKNGNLLHATPNHYARERFFEILDKDGFMQATKKTLYAKYDVGIVGWWYNLNYGGTLTYYALHQVIRKLGFSVLMIAQTSEDPNYHPNKETVPYRFALKHYYISKNHSRYNMQGLNEHCDVFISGSDQLFNPVLWQWSGPEYFLHFVNNNRKKISYASSFGNKFQDVGNLTEKMAYWLKRFDAISVREDYGVDIAKETFGITAQKVLDPVFLCDVNEYIKVANESKEKRDKNYFVNFFLDPTEEKREIIFYAEQKLQCEYINLINADHIEENEKKLHMKNTMANADIEDWLYYYYHSDFIITDSFHGTCFAIIFRKPFISIANTARGEKRFISLLTELGLMNRLVYTFDEIKEKDYLFGDVDYQRVEEILEKKKKDSLDWLYTAITAPKDNCKMSDFRLLDGKIQELEEKIRELSKKIGE
ncbi:MAG: polysaccharide pyruvyl transferase family protein [Lachnospiraceae bacterium]|nr:polysaccharide pyruvyl transferase family protein [Lachnospiraceae bacterium]